MYVSFHLFGSWSSHASNLTLFTFPDLGSIGTRKSGSWQESHPQFEQRDVGPLPGLLVCGHVLCSADDSEIGVDLMSRQQCARLVCPIGTSHRLFGIRTSLCVSHLQLASRFFSLGGILRISAPCLPKVSCESPRHASRLKEQRNPKEVSRMLGYCKKKDQASPKSKADPEPTSKAVIVLSTYQPMAPGQKAVFFR